MKRILLVVALAVVAAIGLGFYRGWIEVWPDTGAGKANLTLSMDNNKFQQDRKAAVASVQDAGQQLKDKIAGPTSRTMDGTVVSVNGDKLTMTDKEGREHSHVLAAAANLTCDGKTCTTLDLKPGMRIRVTTEDAEPHLAIRIEALDINQDFEKGV